MSLPRDQHDVLLITGSQTWTHFPSISQVLRMYASHAFSHNRRLLVVNGKCDRGADALATLWVARHKDQGWPVDEAPYPADWSGPCRPDRCEPGHRRLRANGDEYCPAAGNFRNELMISVGPMWCEGFMRNNSAGTAHCTRQARAAGIPTHVTPWTGRMLRRDGIATLTLAA